MEEFIAKVSDELDINLSEKNEIIQAIEGLDEGKETDFFKSCQGECNTTVTDLSETLGVPSDTVMEILMESFKMGKELAKDIELSLTEQRKDIKEIQKCVNCNDNYNKEEILDRLSSIEDILLNLDIHITGMRKVLSSDNNMKFKELDVDDDNYSRYI